jgi:hypothetical protein
LLQNSVENQFWWLPTTNSIPIGVERVCKTDNVCGKISSETKNLQTLFFFGLLIARQISAIASAAAVLSSSKEAFAISIPVNSITIV